MRYLAVISILVIIIILVIECSLTGSCKFSKTEYFDQIGSSPWDVEIIFATKEHFEKHVITSSFFKGLTAIDLKARHVKSQLPRDYAFDYVNSYTEFTQENKDKITQAMSLIRVHLAEYSKVLNTRWKFVKVSNNMENNYPHTIGDMIVLNDVVMQSELEQFVKTLIHEKFHVLQRMYPLYFQELYKTLEFSKITLRSKPQQQRSNPDLDTSIYIHEPSQTIPIQLYTNSSPSSLAQSSPQLLDDNGYVIAHKQINNKLFGLPTSFYCQLEHPAEISACLLTEIITNNAFLEKEQTNAHVKAARLWLSKYFS